MEVPGGLLQVRTCAVGQIQGEINSRDEIKRSTPFCDTVSLQRHKLRVQDFPLKGEGDSGHTPTFMQLELYTHHTTDHRISKGSAYLNRTSPIY
jgi:hypothetical protein